MKTSIFLKAAVVTAFALAYQSNASAQDGGRMHEGGAMQMNQKFIDENGDGLNDNMHRMSSGQMQGQHSQMHGSGSMNHQNGTTMHGRNRQGSMDHQGSMNNSHGNGQGAGMGGMSSGHGRH